MAAKLEPKMWRLLDANANRAREGLRVVEDTARFILEKEDAATALRTLRHRLDELMRVHYDELIGNRDVEHDPGRMNESKKTGGVPAVLAANFKRCSEALRVVEEYSRVVAPEAVRSVQSIRFQVYQWEKRLQQQH
jgi:thiamine-phosphate pyrophosphorylase